MSNVLPKLQSLWLKCGSELQLTRCNTNFECFNAASSVELESSATASQVPDVHSLIERRSQVQVSIQQQQIP